MYVTRKRLEPTTKAERRYRDVDDPPADEEWRALHRRADAFVPGAIEAFIDSVDVLREGADLVAPDAARGDVFGAVASLPWDDWGAVLEASFASILGELAVSSARVAAPFLTRRTGVVVVGKQEIDFDDVAERATAYGTLRAGQMLREIEPGTRAAILRILRRTPGLSIDDTATLIADLIGLTERQAQAVANRVEEWRRLGITGPALERRRRDYADRLLRLRAENISRTGTIRAGNRGQQLLWETAADGGYIDREKVMQQWIAVVPTDGRTCEVCIGLDGEEVPLGGIFSSGVPAPPTHVAGRCALGLVEVT